MSRKVYIEGNYFIVENPDTGRADISEPSKTVRALVQDSQLKIKLTSNTATSWEYQFDELTDENDAAFASTTALQTFIRENTGFSTALGGSSASTGASTAENISVDNASFDEITGTDQQLVNNSIDNHIYTIRQDIENLTVSGEYTNSDKTNGRLRKYILPSTFDFTNIPADYDNAIWEIRYIYDLEGEDVTLPDNVTLQFNGGRIVNKGVLTGSNTKITADYNQIFDTTGSFSGIWGVYAINPIWFGAIADDTTDSQPAFQAMFNFVNSTDVETCVNIPAGEYYIASTITLPTNSRNRFLNISGYGATLRTDQQNVSIFERMPASNTEALLMISDTVPIIEGIEFRGSQDVGQIGINIGATYSMSVTNCSFSQLESGSIATFALASRWTNLRYNNCTKVPFTLQSAFRDIDNNNVWSGGVQTNSASNVSVIDGVRVFGNSSQFASFVILASDAIKMINCISEGNGALYDVYFDNQGSTTVKNFYVDGFHAEAPDAKVNFKVKSTGQFLLTGLRRSYPAAIADLSGSTSLNFLFENSAYSGNLPPIAFYQPNGDGYGGDSGNASISSSVRFIFKNVSAAFVDENIFELGAYPYNFTSYGNIDSDRRTRFDSNNGYRFSGFGNPSFVLSNLNLLFEDDNIRYIGRRSSTYARPKAIYVGDWGVNFYSEDRISDLKNDELTIPFATIGTITANSTSSITLNSSSFATLSGLTADFLTYVNILDADLPSGIMVVNSSVDANNSLTIRLANITASDIAFTEDVTLKFNALKR